MIVDAIILARGGSKGIPGKNIIDFCGKPLLTWTVEQCMSSSNIRNTWVSSDSQEILDIAIQSGSKSILRPAAISDDYATSESGWLHAIEYISQNYDMPDVILAPQVTSPLRETSDIDRAIKQFSDEGCDSMFSCSLVEDLFFWERGAEGQLRSVNYDSQNRKRRQDIPQQMIENGSFYLFSPNILKKFNNRFGVKTGCVEMEFWKMFEIDSHDDIRMCSALMHEFLMVEK